MHWYSDIATHRHPWAEVFSLGVAAARAVGSRPDEVVLLNFTGWALYLCAERYPEAAAIHSQALDLARELGDRREEAWALTYLSTIGLRTGQLAGVAERAGQAATIFREIGFTIGEEVALRVRGSGLAAHDRYAEALEIHQSVLASYRRRRALGAPGTEGGEATVLLWIAGDLVGLGRVAEAVREYAAARTLFRRTGTPYGEALAAYQQGLAERDLDRLDVAARSLGHAVELFGALGAIAWELRAREAYAVVEQELRAVGVEGGGATSRPRRRAER
jgi:tetratricopeptide (TPR) repeat protein